MKPLSAMETRGIDTVLLDIDDTLTTEGVLTAIAYTCLEKLKLAGLRVVPVTGRPAGWCDHIARMWPVDAVVGENGAFYFYRHAGRLHKRFHDEAPARAAKRATLQAIASRILAEVPGCALASDQAYRETDLAIDFCEDVTPLPLDTAQRIATLMREEGLTAKVSSIHVNGWFGDYDKMTMTQRLFRERFALDMQAGMPSVLFAGDSPNDAPMFEFFDNSVGVANICRFAHTLPARPKYLTLASAGEGFAEIAAHLLRAG